MSEDKQDTDALATEEMLKMFESMESHDLESLTPLEDDLSNMSLEPTQITNHDDEFVLAELALPDVDQSDTVDADIIEMTDDSHLTMDIEPELSEAVSAEEIMPEEIMPEEIMPEEIMPEEIMPEEIMPEEIATPDLATEVVAELNNPITNHLNAVVENAVQALQDWLVLRQQSEENGPQQGLAQLDVLLDTVTHQQQQLADQLKQMPKVDFSEMANALGVTLATPQSLGWSEDQWRIKANEVANKTSDIAAMNAKLRKQFEQF